MRKLWLLIFLLLAVPLQAENTKPNVLLILLDDAGYSDIAGFGRNDAPTPNIRQIANEGVRFTRHYADSTCKPARLALMTGRESARVAQSPDFRGMSSDIVTLADALKTAGYRTAHIGKWHLGDAVRDSWPDKQGFDEWFGFLNQFQLKGPDAEGNFTKRPTYIDPWLQSNHTPLQQYKGNLENILSERVVAAIKESQIKNRQKNTPWFINYWLFAPHHPSTASDDFLKKFPNTPEGKYRALLAQADAEIGKAIQALRDTKQLDNTLIVIASDNGGTNHMTNNNFPYAGVKGEFLEGSLRTPLIIRWPDKRSAGKAIDDIVAIQDIYPTVLAAVGITPTTKLDGENLQPLLDNKQLAPRTLVFEIGSLGLFNHSVLTPNGVLGAQENIYAQWRKKKTELPVQYHVLTKNGQARIAGDDLRRAPGYGAFSFVIGANFPSAVPKDFSYLAWQAGLWSLAYNSDNTFSMQIGNETMRSKPWKSSDTKSCTAISLVTFYTRSRLNPTRNSAHVSLYVNGENIMAWQQNNPAEISGNFSTDTWIGRDDQEQHTWTGYLSKPLFFNAALVDDVQASFDRRVDAEKLVCATTEQ
ncbi:MAG: sulfatase-like hydrolase/transferase [Pseudomonadales bacterium]